MFQAYLDESIEDGRVLVLGGFLASPDRWSAFSGAWQARLDHAPWDYFRMTEVWDRQGDESLEHARWHYSEIPKYVSGAVTMVVPIDVLTTMCDQYDLRTPQLLNPYHWAAKGIVSLLVQHGGEWGLDSPVDFIFDDRSDQENVRKGWEAFGALLPPESKRLLGSGPTFQDDKSTLPLQAADMWVWWCRRAWLGGNFSGRTNPVSWGGDGDFPQIYFELTEEDLRREIKIVRAGLEAGGFLN